MPAALLAPGSPSAGQGQLIKHIQTRSVQGPSGLSRRDFTVLASGGSDKNGRGERGPRDWGRGRQQLFALCKMEVPDPGRVRTKASFSRPAMGLPQSPGAAAEKHNGCVYTCRGGKLSSDLGDWEHEIIRLSQGDLRPLTVTPSRAKMALTLLKYTHSQA